MSVGPVLWLGRSYLRLTVTRLGGGRGGKTLCPWHFTPKTNMPTVDDIESPLEPVEYLARSPSRVKVLDAINEGSRTRNDLRELTAVSRVTLSRILANFEDRGWVERRNGRYEITSEGAFVATELTGLLANMETLEHLDGVMEWLPLAEFDFELACLRDADVSVATWGDHTGQIRHVAETIPGADHIETTASGVSREVLTALWETTVSGETTLAVMIDSLAMEIIQGDPDYRRQVREMIESGTTDCLLYEGENEPLPMVMTCDATVILCGHDEDGPPPGTLETTDPTVHAWATSYFDNIRSASTALQADAFSD